MIKLTRLPESVVSEMKAAVDLVDRSRDSSIYKELIKFYDALKSEEYWKVIFLVLIKLDLESKKVKTEKINCLSDPYLKEIQSYVPVVPFRESPVLEVLYIFLHTLSFCSFSTKTVMQRAINNLVSEEALPEKVMKVILIKNAYGMNGILLPETLKKIIYKKSYSKLLKRMALNAMVIVQNNFLFTFNKEDLKELCDEIGLSQVTYVVLVKGLKNYLGDILDLLPSIIDRDFNNANQNDISDISFYIRDVIINNGMSRYYIVDGVETIPSGAGIVYTKFSKCCPKMQRLIIERVKEIFQRFIFKELDKHYISAKNGHRILSTEEMLWLNTLKSIKI